ncbi:hypothetical protein AVEN_223410-1 [Araneus ventricosus]|uniref:Uncharacterized protein n=1 Tax=Araneus ventricosus TaxID=182803 RepID=A0A4Y2K6E8_ARAVE|nr:hypothetical protein AVEN_223410-1 [Araneus ventricosus]
MGGPHLTFNIKVSTQPLLEKGINLFFTGRPNFVPERFNNIGKQIAHVETETALLCFLPLGYTGTVTWVTWFRKMSLPAKAPDFVPA